MDGPNQGFPLLRNMTGIVRLYVWQLHQFIFEGFIFAQTHTHTQSGLGFMRVRQKSIFTMVISKSNGCFIQGELLYWELIISCWRSKSVCVIILFPNIVFVRFLVFPIDISMSCLMLIYLTNSRILRNCNIFGEIPTYIWSMKNLEML